MHDWPVRTTEWDDSSAEGVSAERSTAKLPERIGRYRVVEMLGEGGFGYVYLANDEQLRRQVAIKVPVAERVQNTKNVEEYLAEARVLAQLDHPHIVPVFDVGRTDDGVPFVVSKWIEGQNLARRMGRGRLTVAEAADLIAVIAEALHYAHRKGLVHRDIKPSNILIDPDGKPFVADFGLALKEEEFGKAARFAGTPAYMSPEQARGEGHRVDGRSDIFSLGVVLYELLTGRRPFRGDSQAELLEEIVGRDVRPLRQIDDRIPKELERICQTALAKRASERYSTARDFAEDLRHFLAHASEEEKQTQGVRVASDTAIAHTPLPPSTPPPSTPPLTPTSTTGHPTSASQPIRIVPKGLRSFDADDADFFLELLPGARDRNGLPESLRFWKSRIEETDPEQTFAVGLLYGPSGCGKSSLVKAGLLPRLSNDIIVVFVEATANETEARILKGLRRQCPDLPATLDLVESIATLRRGRFLPIGKKVLIVLDQFEQWLHAHADMEKTELVQALRQCSAERVQCLIQIRDDFWVAVSRFLRELEIPIIEGKNAALVDLFDRRHARRVLTAFGKAFGSLPELAGELSKEQTQFLDQAVDGLAQEGKIIPVRLALFAEMVKDKPWTPATLKAVGGMEGVGVTFLDETFTASTAPPQHRVHQKAAQSVLRSLLPLTDLNIKGTMRAHGELFTASGYAKPRDFDELLRILDSELRLITPTDPEGPELATAASSPHVEQKFYQLSHDYLVPSLRDWLTKKQKETRRGRATLRLEELSHAWIAKPETRHLPAWWEWLNIRLFTKKRDWSEDQSKMMKAAGRLRVTQTGVVLLIAALLGLAAWYFERQFAEEREQARLENLAQRLLDGELRQVPEIIEELGENRARVEPLLQKAFASAPANSRQKLHASLALLSTGGEPLRFAVERILDCESDEREFGPIFAKVFRHAQDVTEPLTAEVAGFHASVVSSSEYERLSRRAANASVALYRLGQPEKVWAALRHAPDPRFRTYVIQRLAPFHADPRTIAERLDQESDLSVRRALIMCLGLYGESPIAVADRKAWSAKLLSMYSKDEDAGVHSACAWTLRQWSEDAKLSAIDNELAGVTRELVASPRRGPNESHPWFVNGQGQTLVVIPGPSEFLMGSPVTEKGHDKGETQHQRRIPYTFAIAAHEVTIEQYFRYHPNSVPVDKGTPIQAPAFGVTWFNAAGYCNWLSRRENIPRDQWCYEYGPSNQVGAGMTIKPDALKLAGYRLPTEGEWEYACRAGTGTSRYYGESNRLLRHYAWYSVYSVDENPLQVGSLLPNSLGLFDMHGNAAEWTQNRGGLSKSRSNAVPSEDEIASDAIYNDTHFIYRSGGYLNPASDVRSAKRASAEAGERFRHLGFRVVRTIPATDSKK